MAGLSRLLPDEPVVAADTGAKSQPAAACRWRVLLAPCRGRGPEGCSEGRASTNHTSRQRSRVADHGFASLPENEVQLIDHREVVSMFPARGVLLDLAA